MAKPLSHWTGKWIWSPEFVGSTTSGQHQIVYFHRGFNVQDRDAARLTACLSADSRYRLYVNGIPVGSGPGKGDRYRQYSIYGSKGNQPPTNIWSAPTK
jgi:alpha-L-rhamnosidase